MYTCPRPLKVKTSNCIHINHSLVLTTCYTPGKHVGRCRYLCQRGGKVADETDKRNRLQKRQNQRTRDLKEKRLGRQRFTSGSHTQLKGQGSGSKPKNTTEPLTSNGAHMDIVLVHTQSTPNGKEGLRTTGADFRLAPSRAVKNLDSSNGMIRMNGKTDFHFRGVWSREG